VLEKINCFQKFVEYYFNSITAIPQPEQETA
jgi:hypothetical protein